MEIDENVVSLIMELEYLIGNQCYNPNSYNGYTEVYGSAFRYPVCYTDKDGKETKSWHEIKDANRKSINTMCYKFGSNRLYIGGAIVKVLNHIEERCGININELLK